MARCKGVFRRGLRRLRRGLSSLDPRRDGEVRHQAVVREAHKQYSETINKLMLSLLSVSFFCLLTIFGSPDRVLLKEDSTIKIPFTDTVMPFVGFSIVAPFRHRATVYSAYFLRLRVRLRGGTAEHQPALGRNERTADRGYTDALLFA